MDFLITLRAAFGVIFVLFLPGLAWSYVFFKKEIDAAERMTLNFGLSIALPTLAIFYLNRYFGMKITAFNSFLTIIAICAIAIGILWKNKELGIQNIENLISIDKLKLKEKLKPSKNTIALLLILLLAAYLNYIPHANYDYPVHRDEWDRMAYAKAIINDESTAYVEPYLGEKIVTNDLEIGFNLWLAELKLITGLSWLFIFKYFSIFAPVLLVLSSYIFASKFGYGLESAFFVSLIPTTVHLLGPGFLVPSSLAIAFIPLTLLLAFNAADRFYYAALFILSLFLLYLHPSIAVANFGMLAIYLLASKKWSISVPLILAGAFALPLFAPYVFDKGAKAAVVSGFVNFAELYKEFGYLPAIFFVIGVFFILEKRKEDATIAYAALALLFLNLIYRQTEVSLFIVPARNYLILFLLMSIAAGSALAKVKNKKLLLILALIILFVSYQHHASAKYYRIIDEREFNDYLWIKDNLTEEGKALIDPWKAVAFTPIAERKVYSRIVGPAGFKGIKTHYEDNAIYEERNKKIHEFFKNNCNETEFLLANNISIVYAPMGCDNPDMREVKKGIYVSLVEKI